MKSAWRVAGGKFDTELGHWMTASCHRQRKGACGGCYARLSVALDQALEEEDPKALIREVHAAMKAEKPR